MTTDLERQLTDDLHELADHESAMPDLAAIERRGRALRRRGLAARSTAGVAGVAIVAGATVLATAANTGPAPTELPSVHTIAVRMVAAVQRASSDSTYITTNNDGRFITTTYTDLAAPAMEIVRTTESGTLLYRTGMRWHGSHWDTRVIDFGKRDWGDSTRPAGKGATPGPDDSWGIAGPSGPINPAEQLAASLNERQLLDTGQSHQKSVDVTYTYTITGTETVDGQLCYRVVSSGGQHVTMWINKATALPVRTINQEYGLVLTYQWQVARDKAPASLWPTPPAGFTHAAK